mgnify:CR=1 FL=1
MSPGLGATCTAPSYFPRTRGDEPEKEEEKSDD